jgi:DnaJ-class molecular chaperone
MNLTLAQARDGSDVQVEGIDDEVITNVTVQIRHGEERRIVGKELPFFDDPKTRGDVVVRFLIEFPERISEEQRRVVEGVLPIDVAEY